MELKPNSKEPEMNIKFQFFMVGKESFISSEAVIKLCEYFKARYQFHKDNDSFGSDEALVHTGMIDGLDIFHKNLENIIHDGNLSIELDSMGVGQGKTTFFKVDQLKEDKIDGIEE